MKCPLLKLDLREAGHSEPELADCIKEECAWWIKREDCCVMLADRLLQSYK